MKYFFLPLLVLIIVPCEGQDLIVYRADHSTVIFNISNNHRYVIDTGLFYNEKLVGIQIIDDSLKCYYSRSSKVFEKGYSISTIKDIPKKTGAQFIYASKHNSYYKHNFYFNDYRYVSYNGGIAVLKGEAILWNRFKRTPFNMRLDSVNKPTNDLSILAQHPILSPDEKSFLHTSYRYGFFASRPRLYEVEMTTGEMQLISKKAYYYYPSYSANGQYILYVGASSGEFRIYDKEKKADKFDFGFKDAFWLCRHN